MRSTNLLTYLLTYLFTNVSSRTCQLGSGAYLNHTTVICVCLDGLRAFNNVHELCGMCAQMGVAAHRIMYFCIEFPPDCTGVSKSLMLTQ